MQKGELDRAKRRALHIYDEWLETTGALPSRSSWSYELEGIIEDAVEVGVQAAIGVHEKLESEKR